MLSVDVSKGGKIMGKVATPGEEEEGLLPRDEDMWSNKSRALVVDRTIRRVHVTARDDCGQWGHKNGKMSPSHSVAPWQAKS